MRLSISEQIRMLGLTARGGVASDCHAPGGLATKCYRVSFAGFDARTNESRLLRPGANGGDWATAV
jgi:hypothetical protein